MRNKNSLRNSTFVIMGVSLILGVLAPCIFPFNEYKNLTLQSIEKGQNFNYTDRRFPKNGFWVLYVDPENKEYKHYEFYEEQTIVNNLVIGKIYKLFTRTTYAMYSFLALLAAFFVIMIGIMVLSTL